MITKVNNSDLRSDLPEKPGVYLFKSRGKILYIGKARNLKKRVDAYFQDRGHGIVHNLLEQADNLEFIITDDEADALLLEYNLIHQYQPPFNIRLKDDKSFPLIEITTSEPYPGIYYTRRKTENNFYIGPIVDSHKTHELIDTLTRIFKIRTCRESKFNRHIPCLYHHIDRCSAPCVPKISAESYNLRIQDAVHLLKGNKSRILDALETKMVQLSDEFRFEEAQKIKEDILLIRKFVLESYISSVRQFEYDVITLYHDPSRTDCFVILFSIREGKTIRKEFFNFDTAHINNEAILKEFLLAFYRTENIPREIMVPFPPEDSEQLETVFSRIVGRQVKIKLPVRGAKRKMMDLAVTNLNTYIHKTDYTSIGQRVQDALGLTRFPRWIEGFDISHFSERDRVGAAVAFLDGKPYKKQYRNYIIKYASPGDTEALKEVLERRFGNRSTNDFPDLLLIDGGKGQLSAALEIKRKLNIPSDVVSLAKEEERLYLESGQSIIFPEGTPERFLVQNIRDEVHRRAITHHRKRRSSI